MNEEQQDVERWDVTIYDGSPTTELAENGEYVLYEAYEQLKAQLAHEKFLRDTTQVSGGGDAVAVLRDVIDYAESGKVPEPSWIPRIEAIIATLSTPQARPDDFIAPIAGQGVSDNPYSNDPDCNDPNSRAMRWHNSLIKARPDGGAVAWAVTGPMGATARMGSDKPNLTEPGWSARPLVYGDTHSAPTPDVARLVSMWRDRGLRGTKIGDAIHTCADELEEAIAALSQRPVVDEAMVERACAASYGWWKYPENQSERPRLRDAMRAALTAALAPQQPEKGEG